MTCLQGFHFLEDGTQSTSRDFKFSSISFFSLPGGKVSTASTIWSFPLMVSDWCFDFSMCIARGVTIRVTRWYLLQLNAKKKRKKKEERFTCFQWGKFWIFFCGSIRLVYITCQILACLVLQLAFGSPHNLSGCGYDKTIPIATPKCSECLPRYFETTYPISSWLVQRFGSENNSRTHTYKHTRSSYLR